MADKNLVSIQGSYTGALSSAGPTFIGTNNSVEDSGNIPVLVVGAVTSASKDAKYSVVAGEYAKVNASCSVVFNGSKFADGSIESGETYDEKNPYVGSNTPGTVSMNLNGGLDGLYIGRDSLKTHMDALSCFTATCLSSDSYDNNIIHKSGTETAGGVKTFTSSITFGNTSINKTVIDNSSININSSNMGGLLFHYDGAENPTSSLKETSIGTLTLGAKVSVSGDSSFNSSINNFNGITLNDGCSANFEKGDVYAKTQNYTVEDLGDNKVATTKYVLTAIRESATSGMDTKNNTFQGTTTFANAVSLSSTSVVGGKVDASFVNGNVYVADQTGENSSSLAANTKFVKNIAASLSASLCDNKTAIGSNNVPVYLNEGKLTQFTGTQGGASRPVYMNGGSITPITASTGDLTQPVYFKNGTITQCNTMVDIGSKQTVTGVKFFSSISSLFSTGDIHIHDMDITQGQTPTTNHYKGIFFQSSNFNDHYSSARMAGIEEIVDTNGANRLNIVAYQNYQGSLNNAFLNLYVSKDGKQRYAQTPYPTNEDGSPYTSSSTDDTVVPTIGWCNSYYARKDGATFTGSLVLDNNDSCVSKTARSTTFVKGRDVVALKTNGTVEANKYCPAVSIKSQSGSWEIGTYANNKLHFSYITDANYNSNSNVRTAAFEFPADGSDDIVLGNAAVGSSISPIYLSNGKFASCSPVVHIGDSETITGTKTFDGSLFVYGGTNSESSSNFALYNKNFKKGTTISGTTKITTGIEFSDSQKAGTLNRLALIRSQFDANGSSLSLYTYKNELVDKNATMGIFLSANGSTSYGFAPTPPSSNVTNENRISTTGWCNTYLARKDGTTFTGAVSFNESVTTEKTLRVGSTLTTNGGLVVNGGQFELYGNTPYIDFHANKETSEYTARIIQEGDGILRIIPNNSTDSASMLRLGTATIGSKMSPTYLDGGTITECGPKAVGSFTLCGHTNLIWFRPTNIVVPNSNPSSIYVVARNDGNDAKVLIGGTGTGDAASIKLGASGFIYKTFFDYHDYSKSSIRIQLSRPTDLWMNILVF